MSSIPSLKKEYYVLAVSDWSRGMPVTYQRGRLTNMFVMSLQVAALWPLCACMSVCACVRRHQALSRAWYNASDSNQCSFHHWGGTNSKGLKRNSWACLVLIWSQHWKSRVGHRAADKHCSAAGTLVGKKESKLQQDETNSHRAVCNYNFAFWLCCAFFYSFIFRKELLVLWRCCRWLSELKK